MSNLGSKPISTTTLPAGHMCTVCVKGYGSSRDPNLCLPCYPKGINTFLYILTGMINVVFIVFTIRFSLPDVHIEALRKKAKRRAHADRIIHQRVKSTLLDHHNLNLHTNADLAHPHTNSYAEAHVASDVVSKLHVSPSSAPSSAHASNINTQRSVSGSSNHPSPSQILLQIPTPVAWTATRASPIMMLNTFSQFHLGALQPSSSGEASDSLHSVAVIPDPQGLDSAHAHSVHAVAIIRGPSAVAESAEDAKRDVHRTRGSAEIGSKGSVDRTDSSESGEEFKTEVQITGQSGDNVERFGHAAHEEHCEEEEEAYRGGEQGIVIKIMMNYMQVRVLSSVAPYYHNTIIP